MPRSKKSGKIYCEIAGDMDDPTVVGNRLYKIRYVAKRVANFEAKSQEEYADKLGLSAGSYSQWETGYGKITLPNAIKLCEKLEGVTLDYIYRGRREFMSPAWSVPLGEAPDRPGFVPRAPLPRIEPKPRPPKPRARAPRRGR